MLGPPLPHGCHSRESGNLFPLDWDEIPAFAGMTERGSGSSTGRIRLPSSRRMQNPDRPAVLSRRRALVGALALSLLGGAAAAAEDALPVAEVAPGVFVFHGVHEEA